MDDLDDGLVWEEEKRGDGGVQYRQGQRLPAQNLRDRQAGREEPLPENTAGFGD